MSVKKLKGKCVGCNNYTIRFVPVQTNSGGYSSTYCCKDCETQFNDSVKVYRNGKTI